MNTHDSAPPSPPRRPRGRRLATVNHLKGALAHTIRELEAGRIPPKVANALTYTLSVLASVMQSADLEARIAKLEEELLRGRDRQPPRPT